VSVIRKDTDLVRVLLTFTFRVVENADRRILKLFIMNREHGSGIVSPVYNESRKR
jgi:hypothetical protein